MGSSGISRPELGLLCRVGPSVRAVTMFCEWNLAVGSPQGRGLTTRVPQETYIYLYIYIHKFINTTR